MPRSFDNSLMNKISLQLIEIRNSLNLTQEQVYNDTGIHIGRIETAKRDFSINSLKRICDYYQITLSDFFLRIDTLKRTSSIKKHIK